MCWIDPSGETSLMIEIYNFCKIIWALIGPLLDKCKVMKIYAQYYKINVQNILPLYNLSRFFQELRTEMNDSTRASVFNSFAETDACCLIANIRTIVGTSAISKIHNLGDRLEPTLGTTRKAKFSTIMTSMTNTHWLSQCNGVSFMKRH